MGRRSDDIWNVQVIEEVLSLLFHHGIPAPGYREVFRVASTNFHKFPAAWPTAKFSRGGTNARFALA